MGARIALRMMTKHSLPIGCALLISATAGIRGSHERVQRANKDDQLAKAMREKGMESFLSEWYRAPMWNRFVAHPR